MNTREVAFLVVGSAAGMAITLCMAFMSAGTWRRPPGMPACRTIMPGQTLHQKIGGKSSVILNYGKFPAHVGIGILERKTQRRKFIAPKRDQEHPTQNP